MNRPEIEFNSALTKKEALAALLYLPVHMFLLPTVMAALVNKGMIGEAWANLIVYIIGVLYILAFCWKFLRRDFDPFIDQFGHCVLQVCICYGLMLVLNFAVNLLLFQLDPLENPNNAAIMDLASVEFGKTAALAVFMAPILEEIMFRAGIFGMLRKHSRIAAYIVSILAFSAYHVWGYTIGNPGYWIYIVQYIPVSYLLCRCYEKCGSIWGSISLHMVINAISVNMMHTLSQMPGDFM